VRYYRIEIGGDIPATYTSYVNGAVDPGALQIELDITEYPFATPAGNSMVRVWGVSLQTISQASDFNGAPINVYVGMSKGLPLANPLQAGLVCSGTILQAFGNWIGTDMTLDLIIIADGGATQGDPKNFVFNWKKGQPLNEVISSTLATAYPSYTSQINIDPNVVLSQDETAYFQTIEQFAQYIKSMSATVIGGTYAGIDIVLKDGQFNVYDGTTQQNPISINFTDLIGQPTWIGPNIIQFNTVMRADLSVGDYIKFPTTQVTTTAPSQSQTRDKSAFQGVFAINYVRHVGNSRQPDAQSWISTFNCYPVTTA